MNRVTYLMVTRDLYFNVLTADASHNFASKLAKLYETCNIRFSRPNFIFSDSQIWP